MDRNPSLQIKILIVDDHGIVRDGLKAILDGHFHMEVVGSAANGKEAVATAERLKRHPQLAVIPIIVVSGRDVGGNEDRAIKAGAKIYMQKPVQNNELLAVIRKTLGEPEQPGDCEASGNWKLFA